MKRFQIGERVRHVRGLGEGVVVELLYPGWIDWQPDTHPEGALIRCDPSNLQRVQS